MITRNLFTHIAPNNGAIAMVVLNDQVCDVQVEEIERIQKEVENDAIDLNSIVERLDEEAAEVADITVTELTTPTTTVRPPTTTTADPNCPEWWSLCGKPLPILG